MTKSNLKEHRRIPQSFQCVVCDKYFALEDKLSMHMGTHNVKCSQCPEAFKSKEQVTEHKGTNHKEDVGNESEDDDSGDPEVLVEGIEMLEDIVNSEEDSDAPVPVWESLADTWAMIMGDGDDNESDVESDVPVKIEREVGANEGKSEEVNQGRRKSKRRKVKMKKVDSGDEAEMSGVIDGDPNFKAKAEGCKSELNQEIHRLEPRQTLRTFMIFIVK